MTEDNSLDVVLTEVGEFNLQQIFQLLLLCIPNLLSASFIMSYAFTSSTLDYRCKVAECDSDQNNRLIQYDQPWLSLAIPFNNSVLGSCFRYAPAYNLSENTPLREKSIDKSTYENGKCSAEQFDSTQRIECTEFVYRTDETNLQTEFNIHCSDTYKLALVGTVNNIARFIFSPLTGIFADKLGRLTLVIVGTFFSSVFGLIKSFSLNYTMFLIMEFLECSAGTSTYAAIYILTVEWLSSKNRVFGSSLVLTSFPLGEMLLGVLAMYIHDFRYLLRALYTPGLLIVTYFWLVPESVRWLLVTGRVDRAVKILKKTAAANGKKLSDESIEMLNLLYSPSTKREDTQKEFNVETRSLLQSLCIISKSKPLCIRFLSGCFCWIACVFCYYGLSLTSTHIPGADRYISFIIVTAVEIPGLLVAIPLLNCVPRRKLMFILLAVTALTTIATAMTPKASSLIVLALFMIAKAAISCAFSVLYIFTAEVWPTNLRTTMVNLKSMIGRLGGILAPFTPLFAQYLPILPFLLFSGAAFLAALMILSFPETLNKKLPDTVEEAKNL